MKNSKASIFNNPNVILSFLSFLLKIRVFQILLLLVVLGIPKVVISSSQKAPDPCEKAVTQQNSSDLFLSTVNGTLKPPLVRTRGTHHVTMFSIENLGVGSEFLEQVKKVFADPNALEWDLYLQRQTQIEYLKRHLPNNILSRIINIMWSDFYYNRNAEDMENQLLPYLNEGLVREYQLIQPTRLRAMAQFDLHFEGKRWKVQQVKVNSFEQNEALSADHQQDFRIEEGRDFKELNLEDLSGTLIQILQSLASLIREYNPEILHLKASVHFMKTIKRPWSSQIVTNSPEGIHQDGMDFIVPALVIERENIREGQSLIYDAREAPLKEDGNPNFNGRIPNIEITLSPGYGLLHRDRGTSLWHEVTPIELQDPSREGYRSIIGIDFQIK